MGRGVKVKIHKRAFNKIGGKLPNSTKGFKNEGGGMLSVNSRLSIPRVTVKKENLNQRLHLQLSLLSIIEELKYDQMLLF